MKYGALPVDLGYIDAPTDEMMFWLYCPVSLPGSPCSFLPENLGQFDEIVRKVRWHDQAAFTASYVYLTVKTLWVSGEYVGNRPGWHSDGFGTEDVNYIWYDRAPTEFISGDFDLSTDCDASMAEMERIAADREVTTFPEKHLLRLDQRVIHRSPVGFASGMRTFIKVSVSADRYDLLGNSINHRLKPWPMVERREARNHPASQRAPMRAAQ